MKTMSSVRRVMLGKFIFCNISCLQKFGGVAMKSHGGHDKRYCATCNKEFKRG